MINEIRIVANELDKLSLSLDFLTERDGQQILDMVNQRVKEILRARIIDVRKKSETASEGVLLEPFTSTEPNPRPYYVTKDSLGVWSWLYNNAKTVWIENVHNREPDQPVTNLATEDLIEPRFLKVAEGTHSMISVPLFFEDIVIGVYTVEWGQFGKLSSELQKTLEQLAEPIARIVWKSHFHTIDQNHTFEAIKLFGSSILRLATTGVLNTYRAGFIARPFKPEFVDIENYIRPFLNDHGIQAQHYEHPPGRTGPVISEIINEIRGSHFGVVDITGLNPNVMLELGMMMVLERKFILLRQHDDDDDTQMPFDLKAHQIYRYKIEHRDPGSKAEIKVFIPGENRFDSIEPIFLSFIEELQSDPEFAEANPWRP